MKKSISIAIKMSVLILMFTLSTSCQKDLLEFEWKESSNLEQTEWVITRFDNSLTNISEFPQDTIYFIDASSYQINVGLPRQYFLQSLEVGEEDEFQLILKDCSTFGGDFWSWVDQFNIDELELNNKLFQNGTDNEIIVWMEGT